MNNITIKDSTGIDRVFTVVRQPAGGVSAILQQTVAGPGMNRTAYPKIEISSTLVRGNSSPVATVTVPYGAVVNGNFTKEDQVTYVHSSKQPATAPEIARADAEAYARNVVSNAQVIALFTNGTL